MVALTALALRELWISFRLLLLLAVGLAGGMLTALLPPVSGTGSTTTLAWAMTAAGIVTAAVAGGALAGERRRGTAGWLVLRAVPRSSVVVAWFVALAIPVVIGMAAAAVLGWLTLAVAPTSTLALIPLDVWAFAALAAAATAGVLQALAVGLVLGAAARRPLLAAAAAAPLSAILLMPPLMTDLPAYVPGAGLGLLARAESLARPLSDGLGSLGVGLAVLGAMLVVAAALFERADL